MTDTIEAAIIAGAARVLRRRAAIQRQRAADGTVPAGENFPGVMIRSGEAVIADRLANEFTRIAEELEIARCNSEMSL